MVNKSMFRLVCKKSKSNAPQLLGLMLLLVVGVGFYITLFTITWGYENAAKQYLIDHAYADVTIHGAFDYEHVRMVSELEGIVLAQGRNVRDFREGEQIFRIISLTNGINIPFIYEGRRPYNAHEMMILKRNAQAMGLSLGDSLTLGGKTLVITGLAASPEYIYLVQNTRNLMAQPNRFGVVFVADGFFEAGYNEMVLLTSGNAPIHEIMAVSGAISLVLQSEQTNYRQYLDQADKLRSFAYIFPAVFAVLIAMVTYVMLSRTIQKDRNQIGTMKAIGVPNAKIIAIYLSQFCFAALVGAFVGGLGAVALSDIIIATFSGIFEVPTLRFTFFPTLWLS
ncbi:MAG: ABC transporter permease, partial [Defluviitaleaceae bacterium]|nr:ABC transporter permease [Defluviitaleaceae bacterium]